jgi:hypothetical protein
MPLVVSRKSCHSRSLRVERAGDAAAELESLPIDVFGFDVVEVFVPALLLKVDLHIDARHLADRAALNGFGGAEEFRRAAALRAHLHHAIGPLDGLPRGLAIVEIYRKWLFHVNVFAGGDGSHEDVRVSHIGRGDQHRVDVRHRQQLLIMRGLPGFGAECLFDIGRALFAIDAPNVADRDNRGILAGLDQFAQMVARAPAAADLA